MFIAPQCYQNPTQPPQNDKVKIQFIVKESDVPDNRHNSAPSPALKKLFDLKEFTNAKVVFYDIGPDYDHINQNYLENENRIIEFLNNFEGNQRDFESYWIEKDKGELALETGDKFSIEEKSTLKIADGRASGEFELSYGLKSCRIGLFENGILTYVGRPSSYYGKYFEIYEPEAHHEPHHHEEYATWVYVTFTRVY